MPDSSKGTIKELLFRVDARPGKRQELVDFLLWDRKESLAREPRTMRFDIFKDPELEKRFYVIEAYVSDDAFKEHQENAPYKKWSSHEFQQGVVHSHSDLIAVSKRSFRLCW